MLSLKLEFKSLLNIKFHKTVCIIAFCAIAFLLIPALLINYISFAPKLDPNIILWTLNNLFFVCTAEEAIFRGLIQNKLQQKFQQFTYGAQAALVIAAALFGLAHFRGGISYILLSSLAGLFYGFAYQKTQRIEAAILVHFLVNLAHILLFTYPFMA